MGLLDFTPAIKCSYKEGKTDPAKAIRARADSVKWKARRVANASGKQGNDYIEIRKTFSAVDASNVLIIVARDGWTLSNHEKRTPDRFGRSTRGLNVRLSMNNPARMTFFEFAQINEAVEEAKGILLGDPQESKGATHED